MENQDSYDYEYQPQYNRPYQGAGSQYPYPQRGGNRGRGRGRGGKQQQTSFRRPKAVDAPSPSSLAKSTAKKQQPSSGPLAFPVVQHFTLWCSNMAVTTLVHFVFDALQARDSKMADDLSVLQFEYVTTIAFINRILQTAVSFGIRARIPGTSDIKASATGIALPSIVTNYIESLGAYKTPNGILTAPMPGSYREMFPEDSPFMRDPADILIDAHRDVPLGDWPIDDEWINEWNRHTVRPSQSGMHFALVDNSKYEGRAEMLCSYEPVRHTARMIKPWCPMVITEAEIQLGAAYRFRNYRQINHWLPGNKQLLYKAATGREFNDETLITNLVRANFTSPN